MRCLKIAFVALLATLVIAEPNPDEGLDVIELITKYGYPIEQHTIQTEDGYLVEAHRIPYGKNNSDLVDRPVVLLQHGILSSSVDWINMGPQKGLGYLLADAGYDVWMTNSRGTTWSRKHITLDPDWDLAAFWGFSWHEIGVYDLPANIDYILEKTGQKDLFYIGHSQGTTAFYVMASEKPEYNEKIRLSVLMGPAAYMEHLENPMLQLMAMYEYNIEWLSYWVGYYEFNAHSDLGSLMWGTLCENTAIAVTMCANSLFMLAGYDSEQLDPYMMPVIMSNTPAGASTKQMIHFTQEINSGHFRQYDYGLFQNWVEYNQATPPDYSLESITSPVALYYSSNDWLVSITDVNRAIARLPNVVDTHLVAFDKFNHLDFLWAKDVVPLVYSHVIKLMEKYV